MLFSSTLVNSLDLADKALTKAILGIEREGFAPALLDSERTLLKHAGLDSAVPLAPRRRESPFGEEHIGGDIFFHDGDVYFLLSTPKLSGYRYSRYLSTGIAEDEDVLPVVHLRVGIISSSADQLDNRLAAFATIVEKSVLDVLPRNAAAAQSTPFWTREASRPRLSELLTPEADEDGPFCNKAKLLPAEVAGAMILQDQKARDVLLSIARADYVREQDLARKLGLGTEAAKATTSTLIAGNLLRQEYLLECKGKNTAVTRLSNHGQLNAEGVGNLICASCGAQFADHRIASIFSLSELARSLTLQSYWMTIWVTNLLVEMGVGLDAIAWNISERGEEIDMLVEYLDQLWVLELKDRDFAARDAYALSYRTIKYQADRSIIVTTNKIQPDAKRILSESAAEAKRMARTSRHKYIYVEGLDRAKETIQDLMAQVSMTFALRSLSWLEDASGFPLRPVIRAHFHE